MQSHIYSGVLYPAMKDRKQPWQVIFIPGYLYLLFRVCVYVGLSVYPPQLVFILDRSEFVFISDSFCLSF